MTAFGKTFGLFAMPAVAETLGCYLVYLWT